jgi:hypothetical protein
VDVLAQKAKQTMQNIHVNRYQNPNGWQGSIEPDDRSWILFIQDDGSPVLMIEAETEDESGATVRGYVAAADIQQAT